MALLNIKTRGHGQTLECVLIRLQLDTRPNGLKQVVQHPEGSGNLSCFDDFR
jgi:hypothetical protein